MFVLYCISLRSIVNNTAFEWSIESICCEIKEFVAIILFWPMNIGWYPTFPPPKSKSVPIILLPGYGLNKLSFWPLQQYLKTCGFNNIWAINYPILKDNSEAFLQHIHYCVDEMLWRSGNQEVILIGHSMGGLLARQYLIRFDSSKVKAIITIGTPWKGTLLHRIGLGKISELLNINSQMCLSDDIPDCSHLCLWSKRDWIVLPTSNSHQPNYNSKIISDSGHMSMLFSVNVFHSIRNFLNNCNHEK